MTTALPSPTKANLLAGVLAAPDDDTPRLVYADWLLEQGDPRGEFIRVQCGLATRPDPGRREAYQARVRELLKAHGVEWAAPVKAMAMEHDFRRGFVDDVRTTLDRFLAGAEAFAAEPIRGVALRGKSGVSALAESPLVARLARLRLRLGVGDKGAKVLAVSPHLAQLTSFNLGENGIGAAGAKALAELATLRACRALSLSGNPIGDEGLAALAQAPWIATCRGLYLPRAQISDAGLAALAKSPHVAGLTKLCLDGNEDITDAGVGVLAKSPHLGALKRLELRRTSVGKKGATAADERWARGVCAV